MAAKAKKPAKAKAKAKGGSRKGRKQKQPPRRIPLILQPRTVEEENPETGQTERKQITVGELIVRAVKIGAYKAQAAEAAGVRESTLYNWINRGEDALAVAQEKVDDETEVAVKDCPEADQPYVDFVESLKKAEASAEVWHLGNIRRHASRNWTASAWYLERTKRDRYGRGQDGGGSTVPSLVDLQAAVDAAKK
jgi:transposase